MRNRSTIKSLASHCRATMVMLPYAIALGMNDETAIQVFGQAMNIKNHLPDLDAVNREIDDRFGLRTEKQPKTQEEKRRYWRGRQRVYRARRRLEELEARETGLAKLTPEERRALHLDNELSS